MSEKQTSRTYRLIRWIVKTVYPKIEVVGEENLPDQPVILVGNHAQMNGPIACELYTPGKHSIWCAGEMMCLKEVPAYAYADFWAHKPRAVRWFYKLLSYLIAPLSVCVFNNANTIGVYHDARIMTTFKQTVQKLQEGHHVVIFPEHNVPHNHIICQFQDRFVDVAKLCYRRTGQAVQFVPIYLAPALRKLYIGSPVCFDPDAPIAQERERICKYLMDEVTRIACSLPEHRVVPYKSMPKREYPYNTAACTPVK